MSAVLVVQWLARLPRDQKVASSVPAPIISFYVFLLHEESGLLKIIYHHNHNGNVLLTESCLLGLG